jgi:hypothetical protein
MIDSTLITSIRELADEANKVDVFEIAGHEYASRRPVLIEPPALPEPERLLVHTLTGLVDYVKANKDGLTLSEHVAYVASPDRVDMLSKTQGKKHQRFCHVSAICYDRFEAVPTFGFGRYLDPEDLIISLQALFEPTDDRARVLKVLGNIRDENVATRADDGVSQTVTARAGLALVDQVEVPNPVRLAPYRTFHEITQPTSTFIFRMKKGPSGVTAALFEADGGAWRGQAVLDVAAWLRTGLEDTGLAIFA